MLGGPALGPLLSFVLVCVGSLVSIVDPFSAVPVFLALVGGQPRAVQARTALRAAATCLVVLTAFGGAGNLIFSFFGITLPAFRIAGGILMFGVGLEMMRAKRSGTRATNEEEIEAETKEDPGLIPLGLPLLSGPGAIATVMVLVGKAQGVPQKLAVFAVVAGVSVMSFLVLRWSALLARVLGKTGINVVGRLMGLILAALATQFVLDGAREAFPHLLGGK